MTNEKLETELHQFHVCTDASHAIMLYVADKLAIGDSIGMFPMADIFDIISNHFAAPLSDARRHIVDKAVVSILTNYGANSCGTWELAHLLHHILYEEDVATLTAAAGG